MQTEINDIIPVDSLLDACKSIIEDHTYDMNKTKVPSKKKVLKKTIRFWESVQFHLNNSNKK